MGYGEDMMRKNPQDKDRPFTSFCLAKLGLMFLFLFFISVSAFAQELTNLFHDFSTLEAMVINVEGNEVIIDKGRAQGVHFGDIFTVYREGKKIIHPVTKQVIGYLKEPVGQIEITKVEENFATATILRQKGPFKVGAPAVRYADLKVLLLGDDQTMVDKVLVLVRDKLPDLSFQRVRDLHFADLSPDYLAQKEIDLVFLVQGNLLKVYNQGLDLLKIYDLSPLRPAPKAVPSARPPAPGGPYPYTTLRYQQPMVPVFRKVGRLPQVVIDLEMGDLDGDGQPEIVYLTPEALYVTKYRASGAWRYDYKGFGKIINFSLGPRGWIALNIYVDKEGLRSRLLHFTPQGIETRVKDINLILGFFDLNGDGLKETLLGQSYDREKFFGYTVYKIRPAGDKIAYYGKVKVPNGFRILGATFADVDGDGQMEILFQDLGHKLRVFKNGRKQWVSTRKVGGSVYVVQASVGLSRRMYKMAISAEVDPYPIDINGDGRQEVLIVANKSAHHDLIPGVPAYSSGEVLVLTHTSIGYELLPLTGAFEGPLQGLSVVKKEIFVALVKGNPFTQSGESFLLAFPLSMPRSR